MKRIALAVAISAMITTTALASETTFVPTKIEEAEINNEQLNKYNTYEYTLMYTTTDVNMRVEPNLDSEVVTVLPINTQLYVAVFDDTWSIIRYSETEFYFISTQYLSDSETIKSYTDNDLWWMAHLLGGEMMDESWEDQVYTGSVVLNRVNSDKWPGHSLEETITQKKWGKQYACYWDGNFQREPTKTNWECAKYLLENGSQIPSNVVYQSGKALGKVWKHTSAAYYCYGNA